MPEFFLELFSEEIPASIQDHVAPRLGTQIAEILSEHELNFGKISCFATPRRLVVRIEDVANGQQDRVIERRGPRLDAPEKARDGFLRGLGDVVYELDEIEDKKGRFLLARFTENGRSTPAILAEHLPKLLMQFSWPKSMRWGDGELRWVRPLHAINCLFDGNLVAFKLGDIQSGQESFGHRFHCPETIKITNFAQYQQSLKAAKVVLDGVERRELISQGATELARAKGLQLRDDQRLLNELKGLVEWPVPLIGRIDDTFMDLPQEVLTTSMREHQKFLALENQDGQLAPWFITISNVAANDDGKAIIAGNERVLRARLWDAKFFWDQDLKIKLEDRLPALAAMVFHEKLGTLAEKAHRIEQLAIKIAQILPDCSTDQAGCAAKLAKADLVTGMVGEFPELQGIMGGYYAQAEGLEAEIINGIAEHYRFGGETKLSSPVSCAVSLADKLDTLCGFFAAGIRPTGSKDPFALRRMAMGVAWVLRKHQLRLPLRPLIDQAVSAYPALSSDSSEGLVDEILAFIKQRGESSDQLAEQQSRPDYPFNIPSIFQTIAASNDDDLVRLEAKRRALLDLLATNDGQSLIAAYRRASNILRIEAKKDHKNGFNDPFNPRLLEDQAEHELSDKLSNSLKHLELALQKEQFQEAMRELAEIRPAIDAFFDQVLVNANDPALRLNRLQLLQAFCSRADQIADFSLIED